MFLLPAAMASRGAEIGRNWAASLTMGAGQFCTNPGVAVVMHDQLERLSQVTAQALSGVASQIMLTDGIAAAYRNGRDRIRDTPGVRAVLSTSCDQRNATPNLFVVSAQTWINDHTLAEEVFGPLAVIVTVASPDEMEDVARSLTGQLTATMHKDDPDAHLARRLLPILDRKAGRVLVNGFPTGVEVCDSMVHGGPYPASTNFGATSVGTLSIRRFLRPVCYQNLPASILPEEFA